MNGSVISRVFLVALIGAAHAAESEDRIVPVTRAPDNTAISAAKPEFDSIKSSRDPALQQKGDVPRLSVPEMPAASAPGWTPPSKAIQEKKSSNWLVDAMEKQDADRKARNRGDKSDRDRDSPSRNTGDPLRDELKARGEVQTGEARPGQTPDDERRSPSTAVNNPLTGFLGGWMTPQDYALLKPGLDKMALPVGERDAVNPAALRLPGTSLPGTTGPDGSLANGVSPLLPSKTKENPFLQALASPPVAPLGAASNSAAAAMLPPPKPVVTALPPPPPPIEPPKSQLPDFVKPAQDEKYFKPLKRF